MAVLEIGCPECQKPHLWFSGNTDQRCQECQTAGRHIEAVSAITKPKKPMMDKFLDTLAKTLVFLGGGVLGIAALFWAFCVVLLVIDHPLVLLLIASIAVTPWAIIRYHNTIKDHE